MPPAPGTPQRHRPPGPLHEAAAADSTKRTVALLSAGHDIDRQGGDMGFTPLMTASSMGHSRVGRVLLDNGASVSVAGNDGFSALHMSAAGGHLAASKMLVEAGANLEAAADDGYTALHLSAECGCSKVMSMLLEAGANSNCRNSDGGTPLYISAQEGRVDMLKMLLRANADPLLARRDPRTGQEDGLPLEMAVQNGHSEVVRELVRQVGIEGCGGESGGMSALQMAAMTQDLAIMTVLMDAGVVDNGKALTSAIRVGKERSVKFLLHPLEGKSIGDQAAYANFQGLGGRTPLLYALGIGGFSPPSPRIVQLLVDAGADTESALRLTDVSWNAPPLAVATRMLREKKIDGKAATEEQLHKLEGVRRLLLRVEAVHALSWLWPAGTPFAIRTAAAANSTEMVSTSLTRMLPLLRRRAGSPRVLLAALCRWVVCCWCGACCSVLESVAVLLLLDMHVFVV